MLQIQLPDGTLLEHPENATALDVAEKIGSRLAKAVIAARLAIASSTPRGAGGSDRPKPSAPQSC